MPKHLSRGPSREHIPEQMKNKIEVISFPCHEIVLTTLTLTLTTLTTQVMELSDMHNPTCKLHASQSFEDHSPVNINIIAIFIELSDLILL